MKKTLNIEVQEESGFILFHKNFYKILTEEDYIELFNCEFIKEEDSNKD